MPYCTLCGAAATDDARFCTKCGKPLQAGLADEKNEELAEKRAWFEGRLHGLEANYTCAYCLHRRAMNVCGARESPYFGKTIRHEDECKAFANNPAELHFIRAMFMDEYGDRLGLDQRQAVAEFKKALDTGLPKDDELQARLCIGKLLDRWTRSLDLDLSSWTRLAETGEAINEMETALLLDREGGFGFFSEPKNRYQLRRLDLMYMAKGGILSIEKSQAESISDAVAIEYWEKKFALCDYLPSSPLVATLTEAGFSYSRLGKIESAMKCFELVITSAPVDPFDSSGFEVELRQRARAGLKYLHEKA